LEFNVCKNVLDSLLDAFIGGRESNSFLRIPYAKEDNFPILKANHFTPCPANEHFYRNAEISIGKPYSTPQPHPSKPRFLGECLVDLEKILLFLPQMKSTAFEEWSLILRY
jgi:hypothetical protein